MLVSVLLNIDCITGQCNITSVFALQTYSNKSIPALNGIIIQSSNSIFNIYSNGCNEIVSSPLTSNEISTSLNAAGPLEVITVNPNPFNQFIAIDWHKVNLKCQIKLINSLGICLKSMTSNQPAGNTLIQTDDLSPGMYVIYFSNSIYQYSIKLIKY